jgi:hypothetical protein
MSHTAQCTEYAYEFELYAFQQRASFCFLLVDEMEIGDEFFVSCSILIIFYFYHFFWFTRRTELCATTLASDRGV